jgi:acyl-CoA synthetase (AMP-forming)/AMP-acid ligase II
VLVEDQDLVLDPRGGSVRSGDLGSLDRRGQLLFLSRIKDVLKVGGENVPRSRWRPC